MIYFFCFLLFSVGIYGLLIKKNIIKLIVSSVIVSYAVNIFLVLCGYRWQANAPVANSGVEVSNMVDPLPQVLAMVSIITGLAVTAVLVSVAMRLYEKTGTFNLQDINNSRGGD